MDLQLNVDRLSFTLESSEALSFGLDSTNNIEFELLDERLSFELNDADALSFGLEDNASMEFELETPNVIGVNTYDGPYEITPSTETQTLATDNLLMADNVTINPIPSNYGLITWNGSTLTVS